MPKHYLRPLLIVEFLIAIQVVFTIWSQVGGQYHLDLMFWPWKLGLGLAAPALIVAITASLLGAEGRISRRVLMLCSLLILVFAAAGVVTYYYHLNEPVEQQESDDEPTRLSKTLSRDTYQVRHDLPPRTIGSPSLHPKAF
jgi:hypothetical protein